MSFGESNRFQLMCHDCYSSNCWYWTNVRFFMVAYFATLETRRPLNSEFFIYAIFQKAIIIFNCVKWRRYRRLIQKIHNTITTAFYVNYCSSINTAMLETQRKHKPNRYIIIYYVYICTSRTAANRQISIMALLHVFTDTFITVC